MKRSILVLLFLLAGLVAVLVHTRHEGAARKYVRVKRNNTATQETDSNGNKRKRDNEESIDTEDGPPDTKKQKIDDGIDSKSSWWNKAGVIAGASGLLTLPLMFIPMGSGGGGDEDLQSQLHNMDPTVIVSSSSSSCISLTLVVLMITVLLV